MDECLNSNQMSASQLYHDCTSEDPEIQNRGYQNLWRYLYTAARYLINTPEEVQDLAQTTLLKVFEKIHKVREPDAFKSWTRMILRNEHINQLRKRPKEDELPLDLSHDIEFPDVDSKEIIESLFKASQGRKIIWAWLGRYYYGLQDKELADVESLLCRREVRESTYPVARAKSKAQWIKMGLIDKLLDTQFQPIDPTDSDRVLNDLLQQLLIAEDWDPLYQAPFDEGSRWAWIGRHIYETDDGDLARVENLLCKTSIGSKIMQARRSRIRKELKPYLLNFVDV